jgi:flagellar protein FlaG
MPSRFDPVTGTPAMAPSSNVQLGTSSTGKFRAPAYAAPPVPRSIAAVQAAVEQIREMLASANRRLEFSADAATGLVVVTIKDAETGQVIREVPGHAFVAFAEVLAARNDGPRGLIDLTA